MDQAGDAVEKDRRIRRAMRDLVALSTLPAVWVGLGAQRIAESLAEALLNTLPLDLIYISLSDRVAEGAVEVARGRHHPPLDEDALKKKMVAVLRISPAEPPSTMPDPFGSGTLRVAVTRFGVADDSGVLVACSRDPGFPTAEDRLLLGIAANQTAVVIHRAQAERRLHEQREWLQVTLASIGDAVITTDTEGHVTYVNTVAEQLTGWTLQDARGKPLQSIFPIVDEATQQAAENPVDKVLREGSVVGTANHSALVAKDGTLRPIDDSAAPIRDASGRVVGVVMVFREVTAQRRAAQHRNVRLAVTNILSEAGDVQAMEDVLRTLCAGLGWDMGAFWRIDESSGRLVRLATWHRAGAGETELAVANGERSLQRGEGLPGRVWATRKAEWISNVSRDGCSLLTDAVTPDGLHAAFACPVAVGARSLGVIEVLSARVIQPDSDLLEIMSGVAASVGQFLVRQDAAAELRRSEAELAEFFENATVALHWVGPDGRILRANRAELEMLGYAREEYIGRPIAEFHADADVIRDILEKLQAGQELKEYPAQLRCKDGSIRDVLIDSSVAWSDGQFLHTRCFTRDVTERTRAELALADARSQLDTALEAGAIATWIWDIPNNRLFANDHLARLFNLPPSDAHGGLLERYVKSIHPDDVSSVMAALERSIQSGEDYDADYRVVQGDGSLRWVTARGRVERDRAGRAVRMPGVLVDITERKRLEEDLRLRVAELAEANRRKEELLNSLQESEQKLRLLADTIPQLAWMADPDGAIFWYNRRWYDYTGTTPERMGGWGWQSVHDPVELPEVLQRWKACIASGESFEMVFPLRGADGAFRPFLTRVNPLRDSRGQILHWFGTNTDISEIKRMENALREADRRKDEFLATLAHELRNPLAPIRNCLQILKMPRVDAETADQARGMMERQLHALVRLVDDLLDVARVMRGKIELRKEPVELATLVARAVETAQPLIEAHGHRLELSIPQESLVVDADPVRLAQVIANLLTNAAKYTEANGRIRLSAKKCDCTVVVSVRDNGIGIAHDMLPHVFDLFVQADHAFTRSQGGLGIGLTLVKNLTQLHGGTVEARSAGLGKGSEFSLRVPLMAQELSDPGERAQALRQAAPSSGHRLLVVDDNKDAAVSLATLLRMQGHDVRVAHDGASALTAASSFLPRLVFLDIGMPDMDGYEVARRMRRQPGLETVVLAALTGWGQEEDRRRTFAAGFDHHFVKPPELKAIERLLDDL